MEAGLWPRKVMSVGRISKPASKTKGIFKHSHVSADLDTGGKVYCVLQGVPPAEETIACFSLVFNLKRRISSILNWPKFLAPHDLFLAMITAQTSFTGHRRVTCREGHSSCTAAQNPGRNPSPCAWPLTIWNLLITTDFGAEWTFPTVSLLADQIYS